MVVFDPMPKGELVWVFASPFGSDLAAPVLASIVGADAVMFDGTLSSSTPSSGWIAVPFVYTGLPADGVELTPAGEGTSGVSLRRAFTLRTIRGPKCVDDTDEDAESGRCALILMLIAAHHLFSCAAFISLTSFASISNMLMTAS